MKQPITDTQTAPLQVMMVIAPGPFGGAERVLVAGANGLAQRPDCALTVLLIEEARAPEHAALLRDQLLSRVNVVTLVSRSRFDLQLVMALRKIIKAARPTIAHTHGYKASIFTWLAGVRRLTQGWVMTHHGVTAHTRLVRLYERLERFAMRRADRVLAVSAQMRGVLAAKNVPPRKLEVVENMLGLTGVERQGISSDQAIPSILFLGRLSHEKGLDQLCAAVAADGFLSDPDNVRFDIVGDGPQRSVVEPGAPASFKFHGFSDTPDVFLRQAVAMVVPSRTEGMPMAVIEALAAGVPVIGFDVGGMAELVSEGQNGTLVNAENLSGLAAALRAHIEQPAKLLNGAAELKADVRHRYSVQAWCAATLNAYQRALGRADD